MSKGDHLILIDGSAFIFRAFHALPPLTRKSDGLPVGAVAGFCNMIWKMLQEGPTPEKGDEPTHFGVIFDYSSKTFRNEIYSEYKAHRPPAPEDLVPQFGLIRDATRAFNLACIEQEGYEADDLIATYAKQAVEAGATVTIVSSDKDLMQLLKPGITMVDTMRDNVIGPDQVREKFGVGPEKMIDLQALAGDSTDNVPGVPGIGPKTAAQLLDEYGDLETLLSRASEIKQNKRRENLIEFAEQARISRQLVELKQDVPLNHPLEDMIVNHVDGPKAIGFLKALEFTTLTRRVAAATDADADEIEPAGLEIEGWGADAPAAHGPELDSTDAGKANGAAASDTAASGERGFVGTPQQLARSLIEAEKAAIDTGGYACLRSLEELDQWIEEAMLSGVVAVDTETTSLDAMQAKLVGVSLALETEPGGAVKACYIPLGHRTGEEDMFSHEAGGTLVADQIPMDEALKRLKVLLEHPAVLKVAQNLKYDWLVLARSGIHVAPFDDTMLISYALDAGVHSHGDGAGHGMDALSKRWLDHTPIPYKEVAGTGKAKVTFDRVEIEPATAYAAEDADVTLRLWRILKPRLPADRLTRVYERLERPLVPVLVRMEKNGIKV
ncbi:MAG TPA: 5'-3' exonuclease H3TH domain-containing protein, partial [Afifellaceae bacterium]|nr:5'-3' exonuclease H3TH domain-containing protein [Afifellaceae bacterium]